MNFEYQPDDDSEEDEQIAMQAAAAQAKFGNMQPKAPNTSNNVRFANANRCLEKEVWFGWPLFQRRKDEISKLECSQRKK